MAGGFVDIYQSNRKFFEKCYFWKNDDKNNYNLNEYVIKNKPEGFFYARKYNPIMQRKETVSSFMYNKSSLTIETNNLIDIDVNDIIKFSNEYWIVVNIQRIEKLRQMEFMRNNFDGTLIIELRR